MFFEEYVVQFNLLQKPALLIRPLIDIKTPQPLQSKSSTHPVISVLNHLRRHQTVQPFLDLVEAVKAGLVTKLDVKHYKEI